jgi:magnesium chelatase family protein
VARATEIQRARQGRPNADLSPSDLDAIHGFGGPVLELLELRGRQMGLSLRRLHRAARVARTIADLHGSSHVERDHLDEALQHRPKELAA